MKKNGEHEYLIDESAKYLNKMVHPRKEHCALHNTCWNKYDKILEANEKIWELELGLCEKNEKNY